MRLTIEIPESQHQKIKALAALEGLSIKDYILEKALPMTEDELEALEDLKAYLAPRIAQAERGEFSTRTMAQIAERAEAEYAAEL